MSTLPPPDGGDDDGDGDNSVPQEMMELLLDEPAQPKYQQAVGYDGMRKMGLLEEEANAELVERRELEKPWI